MTALSKDYDSKFSRGDFVGATPKANTVIYGGSLVMRVTATGKVEPGADTASCTFAGVAYDRADAGARFVELRRKGVHEYTFASAAITDIGSEVCIVDDQTVALAGTTTNDIVCGRIVELGSAANLVRISIDGYC